MSRALVPAIVAILVMVMCRAAVAIVVGHSIDGELINDGFESVIPDGVGIDADSAIWVTVEYDPVEMEVVSEGNNSVLDSIQHTSPPAGEGSNSLAVRNSAETFGLPGMYHEFATPYTSGIITAEFGFYLTDINFGTSSLYVTFRNDSNTGYYGSEVWVGFGASSYMNVYAGTELQPNQGGVDFYPGGGSDIPLTVGGSAFAYELNTWNNAKIAYDISAKTMTITINGTELDPLPEPSSIAQGMVTGISIQANSSGVAYLDAPVPFPLVAGDFNGDGDVDGGDLDIWKENFGTGSTLATGDADKNGIVDGNDFLIWQRNFNPALATATAAAVPEPHSLLLCSSIAATLAAIRRRNQSLAREVL